MPDPVQSSQKFSCYYRIVVGKASEIGGGWIRDNLVVPAALVLLSALSTLLVYQVRPDWYAIVPMLWLNGIIILVFSFFSIVRAAWRLDNERLLEIEDLKRYKKEKEDSRVQLEFHKLVVKNVVHDFGDDEWEPAFALRLKIVNEAHASRKTAHNVLAKVTYEDENGTTFSQFGRWAESDQPEKFGPLDSKSTLLPMDFLPGSEHELDIAAKFSKDYSCYGVNNDSFPKIRLSGQQLDGPIIKVTVELTSEEVHERFEFWFTNQQVGKGFLVPFIYH